MLHWRILLGTLFTAVLVGLCLLDWALRDLAPGLVLFPLVVMCAMMITHEIMDLLEAGGMHPLRWVCYLGNLLILGCCWGACLWCDYQLKMDLLPVVRTDVDVPWAWSAMASAWTLLGLSAGVLLAFGAEMWRFRHPRGGNIVMNIASSVFTMAYIGLPISFLVQLRMAWGILEALTVVIVAKLVDTGAFTIGRLFGRNQMAPDLSPRKTIEGAIGGLVFACLGSWICFTWLIPGSTDAWRWLTYGLLVGILAILGDLAESLIKRDVNEKDSSHWMPGFGGMLDVFDSMILAAPVAYACWAFRIIG